MSDGQASSSDAHASTTAASVSSDSVSGTAPPRTAAPPTPSEAKWSADLTSPRSHCSDSDETCIIDGIEVKGRLCEPGRLPHQEMETFHLDEATIEKNTHPGWSNCDARTFEVRVGPSYVSGQKTPSARSLYDVFAVDGFYTPLKINAAHKYTSIKAHSSENELRLPEDIDADGSLSRHLRHTLLPPLVSINFMIPYYEPEISTGRCNGEGYAIILYAKMSEKLKTTLTEWVRKYFVPMIKASKSSESSDSESKMAEESSYPNPRECADWQKLTPAIRLLSNFIHAKEGSDMRQRFKCIARAMNLGYSGLSFIVRQMVHQYNAKPFLARTSSTFYNEAPELFAVDIDVHLFGYPARKGLSHFREVVENVIYDAAFVIEGHADDELPECILLCARIAKLGKDKAAQFPDSFMEHAYRSDPEQLRSAKEAPSTVSSSLAASSPRGASGASSAASASAPVLPGTSGAAGTGAGSGSSARSPSATSMSSDPEYASSPKSASAARLWGLFG